MTRYWPSLWLATVAESNRDLAAKFRRAAGVEPTPLSVPAAPPAGPRLSKFTVKLDPGHAEDFDVIVLGARRALGRRVDKSEIVRVVIELLSSDPALRRQVYDQLPTD